MDLYDDLDPREPYGFPPCPLCGEETCICENRFDIEPGFFDEEENEYA